LILWQITIRLFLFWKLEKNTITMI